MAIQKVRLVNRLGYAMGLTIVAIDGPAHGEPVHVEVPPDCLVPERKALRGERYFLGAYTLKPEEAHYFHAASYPGYQDLMMTSAVVLPDSGHYACKNVRPITKRADTGKLVMGIAPAHTHALTYEGPRDEWPPHYWPVWRLVLHNDFPNRAVLRFTCKGGPADGRLQKVWLCPNQSMSHDEKYMVAGDWYFPGVYSDGTNYGPGMLFCQREYIPDQKLIINLASARSKIFPFDDCVLDNESDWHRVSGLP